MKTLILLSSLFLIPFISFAQSQSVLKGKIIDENLNPLQDVSVHLLNSQYGAVTNKEGIFVIKNIFPGNYIINISRIGFAEINEKVVISSNQKEIAITLKPAYQQLNELTVTALKREEPAQQLPASITTLSSKAIENYGITNMNDLTAISPDLYSGDPGDKRSVTSIRGIVTTSYDPAVATYIDGVDQFGLDTYISQLYDVDRIEILRGPQGTLYGRNAMGGVINVITKRPENNTTGFADITYGNYGQQRYTAGIRTALIKDKLFFGAAGMYEGRNGFYTNEFNNSNYDKQHSISGNYYLKYLINSKWEATINAKHTANRNDGPFPLVMGADAALKNPFQLDQNAITEMVDNIFNSSLSLNYSGRTFNFNSQSSYQSDYRYYKTPIDGDFSQADAVSINNNYGKKWNNVNVFTQEFKFTSPATSGNRFKWTAGTYFFHQYSPNKQATIFGKDAALVGSPDIDYSLINTTIARATGVAVYGQETYRAAKKIDITVGLRYDYEHDYQNVLGQYQKDPDPNPQYNFQNDTSATANFSAFSPKVGFTWHYTKDDIAFITYSSGFRTGGLTPLSSDPTQPPLYKYKPEHSNNIEVGSKNIFLNNKLILNTSLFYTIVSDVQVPTLVLPDAVTITKNTGKLTSKGAELEVNSLPVKGLEVDYSFGYTNVKYNSLKLSENNAEVNLAGKRQIFTPDVTSMLAAQYSFEIGHKKNTQLFVRGEWKYLGNQYFDQANTIEQNPYSIFNTRCGINLKKFSIILWGKNLADKKYILYAYDFGAVHLGDPETYGATVSVKF
ncbi:MAG: TonB-dependent receptor [Ginsengibacter sp.]